MLQRPAFVAHEIGCNAAISLIKKGGPGCFAQVHSRLAHKIICHVANDNGRMQERAVMPGSLSDM
eukprot:1855089-Karenia_brevis.AAC.1